MRVVITQATTGSVLMDVSSGAFRTIWGWQLRVHFARYFACTKIFEWLFIAQDKPLDEAAHLHMLAGMDRTTFDIELQGEAVHHEVTALTAMGILELIPILAVRDRAQLWTTVMRRHFVPRPSPRGRHLSNPLLVALRHIRDLPGSVDEEVSVTA